MKLSQGLAILSLFISATAVGQTADPINYNLNCRFAGGPKPGARCHVVMNLHEGEVPGGPRRDHLLVNCDGPGVVYNGEASISTSEGNVFVGAINEELPFVRFPATALQCSQTPTRTSAVLELSTGSVPGSCQVVTASCN